MQYLRRAPEAIEDVVKLGGAPSKSLYVSHFISTWNSRGFEFGAVLFLATIYPATLLPLSIYALSRALAAIALAPSIGRYIDNGDRLSVIRVSILGQRLAVALSCAGFLGLLTLKNVMPKLVQQALFVVLIVLACVEKLCIILNTITVERDWVVVIAADSDGLLQSMNSQMRRIDLFCKLVSPLAIALLNGLSTKIAIIVTFILNITTMTAEYFLIAWVHRRTPALSAPRRYSAPRNSDHELSSWYTSIYQIKTSLLRVVKAYVQSPAFLPSLALSLLYLTVLSFSGQMITYLFAIKHPRLTSIHIGVLRTIATILEISATFIAPRLINRIGAVRAGIWSLAWQFLCLTPGIVPFWLDMKASASFSTYLFITSVILSRIGLWSFDLTAQLLVQNSVDASQCGSFSATESSLQNFFELCTFATTIIWSRPEHFRYPATISLTAIYIAAACYARYVRLERGHLLHMPPCCESITRYKRVPVADEGDEFEMRSDG